MRAQEIDSYDEQQRLYRTQVYDVNPTTGAVSSSALTTNYYYDHRGDVMAEADPGGLWTKSQYDGAGRDVLDSTTDGAYGTYWVEAATVSHDTVLEQEQTVYDGDSNVIETIDSQRFHNATGQGALGTPSSGIGARVYYSADYYDNADRLTSDVDVGTNGGSAWTRPSTPPSPSATALVTTYAYNYTSTGLVLDATDPQGIDTRTLYDNLGRTTKTIQYYTGVENDITTEYGYDGNDNVTYLRADEPSGSYQQTDYVYSVTTASGSGVNSNDILSAIQHPDPTTGQASSYQQESYLVNALGDVVQSSDRAGNVHQYSYDVLGRETSDEVTALGAGVDGSVLQITYAYDSQGNPYLITSWNNSGGIVNQVEDMYNGLGQLTNDYQSHSGAVNTLSTPQVQYAYTEMSGGQNNSRLVSMTYPDGYVLNYNYNSGLDSTISRLSSLSDSTGVLESYKYLGLDTVVERDHPQNNVNQTYIAQPGQPQTGDAGDQYTGLDRFERVVDQNWVNSTTGVSTDNFQYGYNQDGDVLYRQNVVDSLMSELYQYDNLHQLKYFARGTLSGDDTAIDGTPSASQSWTPDALGNFTSVTTGTTTQTRTANQQNEITSMSGQSAPTYDANGNLTADGSGTTYVYNAWNELVAVKEDGEFVVASYSYDGLGRRIVETGMSIPTTDLYYSSADQVLEEDTYGVTQARNVWSIVYVNALVLRDQSSLHNGVLDQRLYVQQDANWNVTALVSTSGTVLERYTYSPYGTVTVLSSTWGVQSDTNYSMPYLWQGMRYEWATNLIFADARVYLPTLMVWMQTDLLGLNAGNNDYEPEGDGPTGAVDPSGLEEIAPFPMPKPPRYGQIVNTGSPTDQQIRTLIKELDARRGGTIEIDKDQLTPSEQILIMLITHQMVKSVPPGGVVELPPQTITGPIRPIEPVGTGGSARNSGPLRRGGPVRSGRTSSQSRTIECENPPTRLRKAPQSGVRGYLKNLRSYWERSTGGLTQEEAAALAKREGFGFEVGRQSRFENARDSVVIGRGNLQEGLVNRMELAEEIQHGLDRATHEASRAMRRGLSNEEFHAELFERIIAQHKAGGHQFLTPEDITAFQQAIKELRGR